MKIGTINSIAILVSSNSWFLKYANDFKNYLNWFGYKTDLYQSHEEINVGYDVLFILSYFKKVPQKVLEKNRFNLVVHESDLPKGKGWAPLFWQILEGKNEIPIVLIDAAEDIDSGDIFLKDSIVLSGCELHDEIRKLQAEKTIEMCIKFLKESDNIIRTPQYGTETFYNKRTPKDSELNVDKSIREQFNLLRIVNNEEFPAFFYLNGSKYILKVFKEEDQ